MKTEFINRRNFVRLSLLASVVGITGCFRDNSSPIFRAPLGTIPKEMLRALPSPWSYKSIKYPALESSFSFSSWAGKHTNLFALGDAWMREIPAVNLKPLGLEAFFPYLDIKARNLMDTFDPNLAKCVFPISVSPWVMIFRNGKAWLPEAKKNWDVLLHPELKGKVVLPNSPRLIFEIAESMNEENSLSLLRQQALSFDDKNALNWLLSGDASVAILPLEICYRYLSKDHRLGIAIPANGSPLHWTMIAQPSTSNEDIPLDWIKDSWQTPMIQKLIARGFMPPLPYEKLLLESNFKNKRNQFFIQLKKESWDKSWSLLPLERSDLSRIENKWRN